MSPHGTAAYDGLSDLPPLVERAVGLARREGFAIRAVLNTGACCSRWPAAPSSSGRPAPAAAWALAWLASGARPGTRLVSVELDPTRAALAAELFSALPHVTVICADWREIYREGPFDLLVLDGGAHGKNGGAHGKNGGAHGKNGGAHGKNGGAHGKNSADPHALLRPGGTLVIDDLTLSREWPPRFQGQPDAARMHWLTHPGLDATELRLAPDLAALAATRRWPTVP